MSGCRPWKWLWGLIPLALIAFFILVGLREQIEQELEKRASLALKEANLQWAASSFRGRDGALLGTVENTAERDRALQVIAAVPGVRKVRDKAKLNLMPTVSPYTWWITLKGDRVKIKGHIPSKTDKRTILGMVKANLPELKIDDRMKEAGGAPERQVWLGAISFALQQVGHLKSGTARLDDTKFSLVGEARSAATYRELKSALTSELPGGVGLKHDGVIPPVIKPFEWSAQLGAAALTLLGNVPDETLRAKLVAHAKAKFAGTAVIDKMQLGAGAPEGWSRAATEALTQLSRLESGEVALSDVMLTVEGVAKDDVIATDVAATVRNRLPAIYKSEERIEPREGPLEVPERKPGSPATDASEPVGSQTAGSVAAPAAAPPEAIPFIWSASRNAGKLTLSGHVPNDDLRRRLIDSARNAFPSAAVDDRMALASGAPEGWMDVARLALAQLRNLESGQARLTDRVLHMSGTAATAADAETIETALASILPETYRSSKAIEVAAIEAIEPDRGDGTAVVNRCQSRINGLMARNTIRFELGRARLLSDSFPLLDDLADLAKQCEGTRIVVGGHTDADGDTLQNLELSRKRAEAVVSFLIDKGVAEKRLMAIGYGDTRPVAPNDDLKNKAKNRRIEFVVKLIR